MNTHVDEIAPDIFRISTYVTQAGLQFAQFLIRDDEPLLYHTGHNSLFAQVLPAVKSLIDVTKLRWISFSHNESDESGSLNQWLGCAPHAVTLAGLIAVRTGLVDSAIRPPKVVEDDARLTIGRHTLRFLITPYVPHSWESSLLHDETEKVLFCSDLLLQRGETDALSDDILTPAVRDLEAGQQTPFHDAIPYTRLTGPTLARLAALAPRVLAPMHGACYRGDGAAVLRAYAGHVKRVLGAP